MKKFYAESELKKFALKKKEMSSLKQLSKIDKRTKYAVYGWVRAAERTLPLQNVPNMITAICILFFRKDEMFKDVDQRDKESIQLSANKKCVTRLKDAEHSTPHIYGINEILSTNVHGRYQWDVKVNHFSNLNYHEMEIGIENVDTSAEGFTAYHYISSGRMSIHKDEMQMYERTDSAAGHAVGHSYGSGDKISIYLDVDKRKLAFNLNGVEQHVFNELEQGEEMKWALSAIFWNKGDSVEIENFKGL